MVSLLLCRIARSIICTRLLWGKMHSDLFNGIKILQCRWQHWEKVGHCYPSGLKKTLCKWDIYVPLVTKELRDRCVLQGASVSAQQNFAIKINSPTRRITKKEVTGELQNRSQNWNWIAQDYMQTLQRQFVSDSFRYTNHISAPELHTVMQYFKLLPLRSSGLWFLGCDAALTGSSLPTSRDNDRKFVPKVAKHLPNDAA
jgi:hypothetical protein